jgi:hypothetical protein
MLGSLGFFASRGMTTVPDLSDLSRTAAESAISAAGLVVGTTTSVSTSNSSLNNIIETQSIQSASVVDYDTVVNYTYYNYVSSPSPTPVVCTGSQNERFQTSWSGNCVNGIEEGTYAIETCYSNCPCVINYYTETRSCGPAPCVFSSQQTYPTNWSGSCVGGVESGTIFTEISYTNCPSTLTSSSTSRSCSTPTSPSGNEGTPGTPNPAGGNFAPSFFPPGTPAQQACIDEDTKMIKIGSDGFRVEVSAKDIVVGDYVLGLKWDELIDQDMYNFLDASSSNLTNPELIPTMVVSKYEYSKNTTMYFNQDMSTRMSLEQPILVYRDDLWIWTSSGDVYISDKIVKYTEDGYTIEETVSSIDYIPETRNVYSFNCEDTDTFFAGNILVHNK